MPTRKSSPSPNSAAARRSAAAKANPWIKHCMAVRAKHPGLKFKDVLIKAKSTYKRS
jgi:hypothetical protein